MIIDENTFQFLIKIAGATAMIAVLSIIAVMSVIILRDGNTPLVQTLDSDLVTIVQYGIAGFIALLAGHGLTHITTSFLARNAVPPAQKGNQP